MKKLILTALAALGGWGLFHKLRKDGKLPRLRIKGTVEDVNHDVGSFRLRSSLDKNLLVDFCVTGQTKFWRVPTREESDGSVRFEDVAVGENLSVSFTKDRQSGNMVAECVVLK